MSGDEVKMESQEDSKSQWQKMTVVQLKGALAQRSLDTDGKKSQLVERIVEYEENKNKDQSMYSFFLLYDNLSVKVYSLTVCSG